MKVLEMNGIQNPHDRVKFWHPENSDSFPEHLSTPTLIYYSPELVKRIKEHISGRPSYIINGQPCADDIRLAVL